jgi:hypothetical protein
LATKNPDAYLPALATTLGYLGVLDRDEDRLEKARAHHEEALTRTVDLHLAYA